MCVCEWQFLVAIGHECVSSRNYKKETIKLLSQWTNSVCGGGAPMCTHSHTFFKLFGWKPTTKATWCIYLLVYLRKKNNNGQITLFGVVCDVVRKNGKKRAMVIFVYLQTWQMTDRVITQILQLFKFHRMVGHYHR